MRRFFIIILTASCLALQAETIRLESGIACEISPRTDADFPLVDYLRLCDRTITTVFALKKGAPVLDLAIFFDPELQADEYRLYPGPASGIRLDLPRDYAAWRGDRKLRRELLNAMLLCRHAFNPTWEGLRAPGWMLAGLDAEIESRLHGEWLMRIGYYPAVRGSYLIGNLPDWGRRFIADADMSDVPETVDEAYMESSRLMLEMGWRMPGGGGNPLSDYLILWLERPEERGRVFMATVGKAALARGNVPAPAGTAEAMTRQLNNWALGRVFSLYQPWPGHEIARRLAEMAAVSMETTDTASGAAVTVSGDWREMADWSARYPETAALALAKSRELAGLRSRAGLVVLRELEAVEIQLQRMAQGGRVNPEEWRRSLDALEPACRRQDAISAALLEYERQHPEASAVPARTVAASRGAAAPPLPPELAEFLAVSERNFLGLAD